MHDTDLAYLGDWVRNGLILRPRYKHEHGTEKQYQRHVYLRDTADDKRRVNCEPCRQAHNAHERARKARRVVAA